MSFDRNIFSRIKNAWNYRSEPEQMRIIAGIYWRSLLSLMICIAIAAIFLGVEEFASVTQAPDLGTAPAGAAAPAISRTQIQATLDVFSARQAQYQIISNTPAPAIADPSK